MITRVYWAHTVFGTQNPERLSSDSRDGINLPPLENETFEINERATRKALMMHLTVLIEGFVNPDILLFGQNLDIEAL